MSRRPYQVLAGVPFIPEGKRGEDRQLDYDRLPRSKVYDQRRHMFVCCDCALNHVMSFVPVKLKAGRHKGKVAVEITAWRHEGETRRDRRKAKIRVTKGGKRV